MTVQSKEAAAVFQRLTCGEVLHTWSPDSCPMAAWMFGRNVFLSCLPMYASLHTVGAVLRGQKLVSYLRETCPNIMWSTMFLTSYAGSLMAFICICRTLAGNRNFLVLQGALPAFLASWSLILERKSRRPELAIYVATQGLWCIWRKARHHGIVTDVPGGDVLAFASSLAILLRHIGRASKHSKQGIVAKILSTLIPTEETSMQPDCIDPPQSSSWMASRSSAPSSSLGSSTSAFSPPPPSTVAAAATTTPAAPAAPAPQKPGKNNANTTINSSIKRLLGALKTSSLWISAAKSLSRLGSRGDFLPPSPHCKHEENCAYRAIALGIRGASMGWMIKTVLGVVKQRRSLKGVLLAPFDANNAPLAITLGGIPALFSAVRCALRHLGSARSELNDLLSGS